MTTIIRRSRQFDPLSRYVTPVGRAGKTFSFLWWVEKKYYIDSPENRPPALPFHNHRVAIDDDTQYGPYA